jgi:hypothetical protein
LFYFTLVIYLILQRTFVMSNLARPVLHLACMRYKPSFKQSNMEVVKLSQSWVDRSSTTVKMPLFKRIEEIEGLLFVKELFDRAARRLEHDTGDRLFDNFEQALSDLAEQC